ncbi:hypothetical protein HPP92_013087 [Vanilla planifolia]|uniref:Equilibrative nucleotide transporter 1 n=1 Tax=Vanilla planifolia TaxID=51239 RepID=A0A835UY41_VANPL|nr:hypothetical protein HPP92_013551 [Vanilla planifolia]KAG0478368.1 hypothetical protein HPP92_013087 [Vanilla planifolia]
MGQMGFPDEDQRQSLIPSPEVFATGDEERSTPKGYPSPPNDRFHFAYAIYFTLGMGFLLPWNAFITAVDYFSYLYPAAPVDRVFAVAYMISCLVPLLVIVGWAHLSAATIRINTGLVLFTASLLVVPVVDVLVVRGVREIYGAYDVTVAAVVLAGVADAFVQGGVIGSAGELPERYMQAVVAGTAASGVLVSAMRVITKSIYTNDPVGLRKSANLYFAVSIVVVLICIICYNLAGKLPVVLYYKEIKAQGLKASEKSRSNVSAWRSTLWSIFRSIKWHGFGVFLIYVVTLSIFPGYITEDVHSKALKDWYPIILITGYNVFDLVGKSLAAIYLMENANAAVGACVARLLFYPLFFGCIHGPEFFRTELPVAVLTCLLGLTNGYFTAVLMILAPKTVPIQHAETAGIVLVLFLVLGLVVGSVVSWFWVI